MKGPRLLLLLTVSGLCTALAVFVPQTQGAPLSGQGQENSREASPGAPNPAQPVIDDINGVVFTSKDKGQRHRQFTRQHAQPTAIPAASSLASPSSASPASSKRPFHVDDFGDVITDEGTFTSAHGRERRSATSFGEDLRRYHERNTSKAPVAFDRERRDCVSFEESPRAPPSDVTKISNPTAPPYRRVCKLFAKYSDGGEYVCSGSLVGENLLATARHCTFSKCTGEAVSTRVACGFSAVSDPYHSDGYAHFGSAYVVSCWRYAAYDDNAECHNGASYGPRAYDIQVCRLDRKLSHLTGYFGAKSEGGVGDQPNIVGYPGDGDLNQFISNATQSMLHRYEIITDVVDSGRVYELANVWAWGGESGCPYYFYDSDDNDRHVIGVHRGGPTGCVEYGRRWTSDWVSTLDDLRGTNIWPKPASHCQVIQFVWDIFSSYDGHLHGVRADHNSSTNTYHSSTTVTQGEAFTVRGTLFNVGTHSASVTVRVVYLAPSSSLSSYSTLWEGTVTVDSEHRYRLTRSVTATMSPSSSPYYVGIVWSAPGCRAEDPQHLIAGEVTVQASSSNGDEDDDHGSNTDVDNDDSSGASSSSTGVFAGSVVGGIAVIVLVVGVVLCARGSSSASGTHAEHHMAAADAGTRYVPGVS